MSQIVLFLLRQAQRYGEFTAYLPNQNKARNLRRAIYSARQQPDKYPGEPATTWDFRIENFQPDPTEAMPDRWSFTIVSRSTEYKRDLKSAGTKVEDFDAEARSAYPEMDDQTQALQDLYGGGPDDGKE